MYDELWYCKMVCMGSRLQVDYIDLYQIHRFDHNTSIKETIEALNDLITMGKVRYWCFIHVCQEKGRYYPMVTSSTWSTWWKTQQYSLRVISTH
jgi:predicted oxidoreductase